MRCSMCCHCFRTAPISTASSEFRREPESQNDIRAEDSADDGLGWFENSAHLLLDKETVRSEEDRPQNGLHGAAAASRRRTAALGVYGRSDSPWLLPLAHPMEMGMSSSRNRQNDFRSEKQIVLDGSASS